MVIDTLLCHDWADQQEVIEYLPCGWQEYVGAPAAHTPGLTPKSISVMQPFHDPEGDTSRGYDGVIAPAGVVDPESVAVERGVDAAILVAGSGRLIPADNNTQFATALCSAINDWCIDRWLSGTRRLWGSLLVPTQIPERAVAEINRVGSHPRIAQVLLSGNGLGKPFGHPLYHPIYHAAVEHDLPVALHIGADGPPDTLTTSAAIANPLTYTEETLLGVHSMMTHVITLIGQGVFAKFPGLRILLVGGGIGWIGPTLWRYETNYEAFGRDAPWLTESPLKVFRDNFWLSSYQIEDRAMVEVIDRTFAGLSDRICYGSGYPMRDALAPAEVLARLPGSWRDGVLSGNALRLYGSRGPVGGRLRESEEVSR